MRVPAQTSVPSMVRRPGSFGGVGWLVPFSVQRSARVDWVGVGWVVSAGSADGSFLDAVGRGVESLRLGKDDPFLVELLRWFRTS